MIKGDIFFNLSVRSVRLNFLRSMLAAIGIVIGVVAISSMGMLGTNMQLEVKEQLGNGKHHRYILRYRQDGAARVHPAHHHHHLPV